MSVRCSPKERAEVLQFSLAALHLHSPIENASLVLESAPSTAMFHNFVEKRKSRYYTELEFYHQCYDATLALALALNKTIEGIARDIFQTDKCIGL